MKEHFPFFENNKEHHYLDNSATTQELRISLEASRKWSEGGRGNPGRGLHPLARRADEALSMSRQTVADFLHSSPEQIVFCSGATSAARALGRALPVDHMALSLAEHHSTILPWMSEGKRISWIELLPDGSPDPDSLRRALKSGAQAAAIVHVSNVVGGENDLALFAKICKEAGVPLVADGTQAIGRSLLKPGESGVDFYFFSGHKCYGPDGAGVLWGSEKALKEMAPLFPGGGMVQKVDQEGYTARRDIPQRHEGGTLPLEAIVGLASALDWIGEREDWLVGHEAAIAEKAREILGESGAEIMGQMKGPGPVSFRMEGIPGHDLAEIASRQGVALRAGRHCAEPLHRAWGWSESTRVSFAAYSDEGDLRALERALREARAIFGS